MESIGRVNRWNRYAVTGVLSIALATSAVPCTALADEGSGRGVVDPGAKKNVTEGAAYAKDENVYGVLSSTGAVENLYVVNQFEVEDEGQIIDFGMYDAVENLTNRHLIESVEGEQAFAAEKGMNYYRGTIEGGAIPWNISIGYTLDGKSVSADQLPGAQGAFGLSIATSCNTAFETSEFFEHYMLQISFTVPADKVSAIDAGKGGIVADAGADKQITYTVMPNKEADLSFYADVVDFEMGSISIAAAPFSMDIDDFDSDEMMGGMQDLADAVREVADGTSELRDGTHELSDGTIELADGTIELADGTWEFADGVSELASGTKDLPSGVQQLAGGAEQIHEGLEGLVQMLEAAQGEAASIEGAIASVDESIEALEEAKSALVGLKGSFFETVDTQVATEEVSPSVSAPSRTATASGERSEFGGSASSRADTETVYVTNTVTETVTTTVTRGIDDTCVTSAVAQIDAKIADLTEAKRVLERVRDVSVRASAADDAAHPSPVVLASGLRDGAQSLAQGLGALTDQMPELIGGIDQLASGAVELADGTSELADGTVELSDGTSELADGVGEFDDGLQEFADETADLPQQMQDGIDEAMADYRHDFDPVSFASPLNDSTKYVQFALSVRPVELPDESVPVEENGMPGFFERVAALFSF